MTTPTPLPFTIEAFDRAVRAEKGSGRVEIDGTDVTSFVSGVAFEADARDGGVGRVRLDLRPGLAGKVTGVAVIDVHLSPRDESEQFKSVLVMTEAWIRSLAGDDLLAAAVQHHLTSMADDPGAATVGAIADLFHALFIERDLEPGEPEPT